MKEFTSQTGGRYTYVDDILNLQELSLAITSIFDGCDNFIISGCQVSGNQLSPGFVYLNGKIRYCSGSNSVTSWPTYIYESNTTENVSYADSGAKIGRNVYGCVVGASVPSVPEGLTGAVPQAISIESDGKAIRIKDAFFGKYAVVLDGMYNSQSVAKDLSITGSVSANHIKANRDIVVGSGNNSATISYDEAGNLHIQSLLQGKSPYKIDITKDGAFQFYVGDSLLASLDSNGFTTSVPFTATSVKGGNIVVSSDNIYNHGTVSNDGVLKINMLGCNGVTNYFRKTLIGDGKNNVLVEVNGQEKACKIYANLTVSASTDAALNMAHATLPKTDKTLQLFIDWKDKDNAVIGNIGYTSTTDYDLYIKNTIGNIKLDSDVYVSKKLFINGVDIMSVLVGKPDFANQMSQKANVSDVYSKTESDATFLKRTDSIDVLVTGAGGGETGKSALRDCIGAASQADFTMAVQKDKMFQDIVTYGLPDQHDITYIQKLNTRRKALCESIGAAYKSDVQLAPKDSGWQTIDVKNCNINTKLYVRQIGNVVSIQGELHTHHNGTIFTLPNMIDPPTHKIGYSHNKNGAWHCTINGGSRDCVVDLCNGGCGEYIGFLITYIV